MMNILTQGSVSDALAAGWWNCWIIWTGVVGLCLSCVEHLPGRVSATWESWIQLPSYCFVNLPCYHRVLKRWCFNTCFCLGFYIIILWLQLICCQACESSCDELPHNWGSLSPDGCWSYTTTIICWCCPSMACRGVLHVKVVLWRCRKMCRTN